MFTPFTPTLVTFWRNYVLSAERLGTDRPTSLAKIEAKYGPDNRALVDAALLEYDEAQNAVMSEGA
jgi:hypothetical protein